MKVLLLKDIEKLGDFGSILEVTPGYARNYLLPKGLALEATPHNLRKVEQEKSKKASRSMKVKLEAEKLANRLESLSCTIAKQVGENDRLFGSVTSIDIVKYLEAEGIKINKKCIQLRDPLKSLGVYDILIKLHHELTANLKVWVVKK